MDMFLMVLPIDGGAGGIPCGAGGREKKKVSHYWCWKVATTGFAPERIAVARKIIDGEGRRHNNF